MVAIWPFLNGLPEKIDLAIWPFLTFLIMKKIVYLRACFGEILAKNAIF